MTIEFKDYTTNEIPDDAVFELDGSTLSIIEETSHAKKELRNKQWTDKTETRKRVVEVFNLDFVERILDGSTIIWPEVTHGNTR